MLGGGRRGLPVEAQALGRRALANARQEFPFQLLKQLVLHSHMNASAKRLGWSPLKDASRAKQKNGEYLARSRGFGWWRRCLQQSLVLFLLCAHQLEKLFLSRSIAKISVRPRRGRC